MATDPEIQPHHPSQTPFVVDLRVSPPTCSLSGNPPFIVTTSFLCTTARPIYALIGLFNDFASHIVIRDFHNLLGTGKNRRIGCSINMDDEWEPEELEREDASLAWLAPGETFETKYTFAVVPKVAGFRRSDIYHMKEMGSMFWSWGPGGVGRCMRRICRGGWGRGG